jgi:hypothetical protein
MHGERNDQLPRTEGKSRQRLTGVDKAAGHGRLGPTVYMVCHFNLKDSTITSMTVQRAFPGGSSIPPPSAR